MPIERIPATEAFARVQKTAHAFWPDGRGPTNRLTGVARAVPSPSFTFSRDMPVMTIGSCFARNIERRLVQLGFELPMTAVNIPREERVSETANDILNKYTVHSMENEIRWAFEAPGVPHEELFLDLGDGTWHDPHLAPNLVPASFDRVLERRREVQAAMARLPECGLVIVTLGLAEAWYDLRTSLYLNGTPPRAAIAREPDRFCLDVLGHDEILEGLERIRALLARYGHPEARMLVTVSPVPFKATFTGRDALVANSYSKSVQRAACESFVRQHADVDYFPSYEAVTLTDRRIAFEVDNIHVRPEVVDAIMATVLETYAGAAPGGAAAAGDVPGLNRRSDPAQVMSAASAFFREQRYDECAAAYDYLFRKHGAKLDHAMRAQALARHGVVLLRLRRTQEGVAQLLAAIAYDPGDARLHFKLGIGFSRLRQPEEAAQWLGKAVALDPRSADYRWRLGSELIRLERPEEAVLHLDEALRLDPDHAAARDELARLHRRSPRSAPAQPVAA
ncbi:GSCFA domain-containing protein [Muricoccus radiodurans]|uniref:GSCFA domain-containing protein n=1 Tax=Muricoccus radiodurans TaxID=2231721 RepID=UPI003CED19FD